MLELLAPISSWRVAERSLIGMLGKRCAERCHVSAGVNAQLNADPLKANALPRALPNKSDLSLAV